MKKYIIILLSILSVFRVFSQNQPVLNVGSSFPIFFKKSLYVDGVTHGSTSISGVQFIIEKPIAIHIDKNIFSINPGLFYAFYSEEKASPSSALGGQSSGSYKHKAFGVQSKFLYKINTLSGNKSIFYSGLITGAYLYTETQGNESGSILLNPPHSWSSETDGDGKLFFNSLILGIVGGIKPNNNRNSIIKPAFELSFFPFYAKLLDYHTPREDLTKNNSMSQISVIFGIGIKKAAHNKRL